MESLVIALALCVASSVAYAGGALMQEQVASRPMSALVRTPRWWVAIGGNGVAALLHVLALRYGPLVLVQSLGVLTLVLAVPLAALSARRRVDPAEGGAALLTAVGLAGLMALIGSSAASALSGVQLVGLLLVTAAVLIALGVPATGGSRAGGAGGAGLRAAAAGGVAFGVASAVTQTLTLWTADAGLGALLRPAGATALAAVVALNVAGLWFTQLSYRGGLAAPLAVGNLANPLAATAIGMVLLGERFTSGAAGAALVAVCAVAITAGVWRLTTTGTTVTPAYDPAPSPAPQPASAAARA